MDGYRKQTRGCLGLRAGTNGEQPLHGYRIFFGGDENILELVEAVVAQDCEGTKYHGVAHFKMVNFMLWELHFNKERAGRGRVGGETPRMKSELTSPGVLAVLRSYRPLASLPGTPAVLLAPPGTIYLALFPKLNHFQFASLLNELHSLVFY